MRTIQGSGNGTVANGPRGADLHAILPWPGTKVLPLGDRHGEESAGVMLGTSEMRLDLQAPIDNLRSFRSDLEAYYWDHAGDGAPQERQRYQISLWIRLVSERTAALEGILMHMGTRTVVVSGVSPAERETLGAAATLLDRWVHEGEPFDDVRDGVAAILNAADMLGLRAASGRPDDGSRPDAS